MREPAEPLAEAAAAPGESAEAEAVDMETGEEPAVAAAPVAAVVTAAAAEEEVGADEAPELDFEEADEQVRALSVPVRVQVLGLDMI